MQIDYTSRDFNSLKTDLVSLIGQRTSTTWSPTDYSDLGNVLVEAFAYMGDIMSHYLDRIANETSLATAIQTDTLLNFAALYDYHPSGPTPATVTIVFTNSSTTSSIDIPIGTQVIAPLSYGNYTQACFETTQSASALAPLDHISLTAVEGKTVNTDRPDLIDPTYNKPLPANIGSSTGQPDQQFIILDSNIVDSSVTVYVGQGIAFNAWSYVDSLLEYGPTDSVFTTIRNSDGTLTIVFGNGAEGAIPLQGQLISALYKTSVGVAGNIVSNSLTEVTFIPGNTNLLSVNYLSVSNPSPAIGGADAISNTDLRTQIKNAIVTRGRAVTLADYGYLATQVSQVGKASAAGTPSFVMVSIQPLSVTDPTAGYKSANVLSAVAGGTITGVTTGGGNVIYATTAIVPIGSVITISGATPSGYNGVFTVTNAILGTSFTVVNATTGAMTGTVTFTGVATYTTDSVGHTFEDEQTIYIAGMFPTTLATSGIIKAVGATSPSTSYTINNTAPAGTVSTSGGYAWNTTTTNFFTNTLVPAVRAYMTPLIQVGTTMPLVPPVYVPIWLQVSVIVGPSYKNSDVKLGIYQALFGNNGFFQYSNNTFGRVIYTSALYNVINNVVGVSSSTITMFSVDGSATVGNNQMTIASASGAAGVVTYYGYNNFLPGSVVNITGLPTTTGSSLNLSNQIITSSTSNSFTINNSTVGTSSGTGLAVVNGYIAAFDQQIAFLTPSSLVVNTVGGV